MDKYEASVWRVPNPTTANTKLVAKIQSGKVTVADLTASGATQLGVAGPEYAPCADSGQNCANDIYAVSLLGVTPAAFITWFQAQQACTNAGKRLPSNAEWQAAVAGTPDPGPDNGTTDCNTNSTMSVVLTESAAAASHHAAPSTWWATCSSGWPYWVPRSTVCGSWSPGVSPTGDIQCVAGADTTGEPGALLRGGGWFDAAGAGPLAVAGDPVPSDSSDAIGFRCAR